MYQPHLKMTKHHPLDSTKPNTSTFNPNISNLQQGTVHLSDDSESDTDYGITDEEMARACQDKTFRKNFKLLAAQ